MGRGRRKNFRPQQAQNQTQSRTDAWENGLTNLGTTYDKTMAGRFSAGQVLDLETLEALYHHSDIARRVVEAVPDETWRRGIELVAEGDDEDVAYALNQRLEELRIVEKFHEAHIAGRRDGTAAILLGAEDGQEPWQPLQVERVRSFEWVRVVDGRELWPEKYYEDGGRAGEPELYRYTPISGRGTTTVHESRLILFEGARTSRMERLRNGGRAHSVLQPMHDVLRQFETGWKAVEHLLTDGYQAIMKVNGLAAQMGANGRSKIEARMRDIDMFRSVGRPILLDAGNTGSGQPEESFERTTVSFEQIPNVLEKFTLRMASAARMPVSKLMGQAPAGLNATGASDIRFWYDDIESEERHQTQNILRATAIIIAADKLAIEPSDVTVKWPPLWQESRQEKETADKLRADRLNGYVQNGVLLAEEVTLSEFSGKDSDVQLSDESLEARRAALKTELEKIEEPPEPLEPEPPVVPPTPSESPEEPKPESQPEESPDAQRQDDKARDVGGKFAGGEHPDGGARLQRLKASANAEREIARAEWSATRAESRALTGNSASLHSAMLLSGHGVPLDGAGIDAVLAGGDPPNEENVALASGVALVALDKESAEPIQGDKRAAIAEVFRRNYGLLNRQARWARETVERRQDGDDQPRDELGRFGEGGGGKTGSGSKERAQEKARSATRERKAEEYSTRAYEAEASAMNALTEKAEQLRSGKQEQLQKAEAAKDEILEQADDPVALQSAAYYSAQMATADAEDKKLLAARRAEHARNLSDKDRELHEKLVPHEREYQQAEADLASADELEEIAIGDRYEKIDKVTEAIKAGDLNTARELSEEIADEYGDHLPDGVLPEPGLIKTKAFTKAWKKRWKEERGRQDGSRG